MIAQESGGERPARYLAAQWLKALQDGKPIPLADEHDPPGFTALAERFLLTDTDHSS